MSRDPFPRAVHAAPIPAQAGVGLRFPHHDAVLAGEAKAHWFEVHPENYLGQGLAAEILGAVRRDTPIALHATGLSLGSASGIDLGHLSAIAELTQRVQPGIISDHLSWSAANGVHLPDLLPLPYTHEALDIFCGNIDCVQTRLGRSILIENPSVYLGFAHSEMSEGTFLAELAKRSDCGILLDINNIAVSATNLGEDPVTRLHMMLDAIPGGVIGEIHLAGHAVRGLSNDRKVRIDDHGSPVSPEVWHLYDIAIRWLGARPTLIEWDTAIPGFEILANEAAIAQSVMAQALEIRHVDIG